MSTNAKTCRAVSYDPFFPEPHCGFESAVVPSSRFASSAKSHSVGIEDHETSVFFFHKGVGSC